MKGYLHVLIDVCIAFVKVGFECGFHHALCLLFAMPLWDITLVVRYWSDPHVEEGMKCGIPSKQSNGALYLVPTVTGQGTTGDSPASLVEKGMRVFIWQIWMLNSSRTPVNGK